MITKEQLEERKETLLADIEIVRNRLTDWDKKKLEDSALLNALSGALQQCKDINDESGDDGVVSDES